MIRPEKYENMKYENMKYEIWNQKKETLGNLSLENELKLWLLIVISFRINM